VPPTTTTTTTTIAPVTFTVTYDGATSSSGTVPTDATTYASGANVTVAGNSGGLAKSGYSFNGWCTTQPAAGAACGGTSRAVASTFAISGNTTLYAVWTTDRTIAIDAGSYSATYNRYATAPTLTSTASAGAGTKTYSSSTTSVCTINSATGVVSLVTAGTCTLQVSIALDDVYSSATSATISLTVTYAIGDTGPAGGKIFILPSTAGNTTGKYFESALGTWYSGSDINRAWCHTSSTLVGGASGTAIGDGATNTSAIAAFCTSGAAWEAAAHEAGGFSDWFLPSKTELEQLYARRASVGGFLTLSQCCGGVAGTTTISYWSSSEVASNQAVPVHFGEGFGGGGGDNYGKQYGFNVRPVRMFSPIG
jgi:hypothetical protein